MSHQAQVSHFFLRDCVFDRTIPRQMFSTACSEAGRFVDELGVDGRRFFSIPNNRADRLCQLELIAIVGLLGEWRMGWRRDRERLQRRDRTEFLKRRATLSIMSEAIEFGIDQLGANAKLRLWAGYPGSRVLARWYSDTGEIMLHELLIGFLIDPTDGFKPLHDLAFRLTLPGGSPRPSGVVGSNNLDYCVQEIPRLAPNPRHRLERAMRWAYSRMLEPQISAALAASDEAAFAAIPWIPEWNDPVHLPAALERALLCGIAYLVFDVFTKAGAGINLASETIDRAKTALCIACAHKRFCITFELRGAELALTVRDSSKSGKVIVRCENAELLTVLGSDRLQFLVRHLRVSGAAEMMESLLGVVLSSA